MHRPFQVLQSSVVCALGFLAAGCTHQLPTWGDADGDSQLAQADPSVRDQSPGNDAPADSGSGGGEGDGPSEGSGDGSSEGEGGADAGDAGQAEQEPEGETEAGSTGEGEGGRPPLPKPLHSRVDKSCGKAPGIGQRVKGFKLPSPAGKNISPGNYRGRVVLLNFWGTWCKPCLKELPEFDRLFRRYRKHGLTVVAVATDDDAGAVQDFVKERKLSTKVAIKGESAASQYGARTFPFSFIVDHNGVIRAAYNGYKPNCMGKLEDDIRKQLAKLPPK